MQKDTVKRAVLDIVRGVLIALLTNLLAVLLIAVITKYTGIEATLATAINQVAKVLAIAVGALVGFRSGRWGIVTGALTGAIYTAVSFGVFSLMAGRSLFADVSVFDFLIGIAAGIFAGVAAVNIRTMERKPRRAKAQTRGIKSAT